MATADNQFVNPFAQLTRMPGMRQLLILIGLAASISIGVTAAFWMSNPGYTVLFSNVSDKEVERDRQRAHQRRHSLSAGQQQRRRYRTGRTGPRSTAQACRAGPAEEFRFRP